MLSRFARHIVHNAVAYLALFIALGGSSYAVTAVRSNSVGSKQLRKGAVHTADLAGNAVTTGKVKNGSLLAQDFRAGQLPAGAKGDTGPPGPTGPAGSQGPPGVARAYAHIRREELVASDSSGIGGFTMGCPNDGSPCDVPRASGDESEVEYCFKLSFTPTSIQVTPDGGSSNGDAANEATRWAVHLPARGVGVSNAGCPPGYSSAEVEAYAGASSLAATGIYVAFN